MWVFWVEANFLEAKSKLWHLARANCMVGAPTAKLTTLLPGIPYIKPREPHK